MAIAPGARFDRYEILASLGKGGMGEVYLALDTHLNRKLALKLLPDEFTRDEDRVRRFEQEARAASALNHPNIITIFEIGHVDGVHFIATEFIDGQTLRDRMTRERMTLPEALDVAIQVASALVAAHAAGVVHRDIKPENVMVRPDGYVKVVDFGLAKLTETEAPGADAEAVTVAALRTEAHVVMGTARYMSPEQARGLQVDARTDIFSLGVVLYEMLAGAAPFEGATTNEVIAAILLKDAPPLARYRPEAPAELQRILAKTLCNNREARYQGVQDVLIDLKNLRQELDVKKATAAINWYARAAPSTSSAEYLVRQIKRHTLGASLAVATVILAVVAASYFTWGGEAIDSVAILPFTNVESTPDTEWLSDGITESLIRDLSQVARLDVRPRHAVFRYKGREVDPEVVGRELNVEAVLTGRLVRRGDTLTISLELVEVRGNRQLWGDQYEYQLGDLLQAQKDISRAVADNLRLRLSGAEAQQLARRSTNNAEAHELYLKGRFHWSQLSGDGMKQAIAYFQQALKKDPNYALPYVGLADAYTYLGEDLWPPKEAMPHAKAYALEALRLDGGLAEAHAALGIVKLLYEWDWPAAERELAPNLDAGQTVETFACALHYADPLGRNDEAIVEIRRALERDPLSLVAGQEFGCASYYGRHYDQAIKQFGEMIAAHPDHMGARFGIGRAYAQKGMHEEAIAALSRAMTLSDNWPPVVADLGYAYAASGRRTEALKLIQQLSEQATRRYVDPYLFATVYIGLGEKDQTFTWLEKAYQDRSGFLPWLKVEPKWDGLHRDPRFTDLLRRVGLAS